MQTHICKYVKTWHKHTPHPHTRTHTNLWCAQTHVCLSTSWKTLPNPNDLLRAWLPFLVGSAPSCSSAVLCDLTVIGSLGDSSLEGGTSHCSIPLRHRVTQSHISQRCNSTVCMQHYLIQALKKTTLSMYKAWLYILDWGKHKQSHKDQSRLSDWSDKCVGGGFL